MTRCVVLLSGGQDSTTCLYWAKARFESVEAIGFHYGQRHAVEIEQATKITAIANVPYQVFPLKDLLADSALINPAQDVNAPHERDPSLPASFVPGRNLLFFSIAGAYAYSRGIHDIVAGMCQTDFSGYPDCRRVFLDSMERTLSLAMTPHEFRIHAPIMDLDKADTFKLAADLGVLDVILEHTHTDYHGDRGLRNPWGYGRLDNEASRIRARGWEEFCRRYPDLARRH